MKIIFQGKEYGSLAKCYEGNKRVVKVALATARKRIKSGISINDALLNPPQKAFQTKFGVHTVEGIEYPNLPSIAKAYSMTPSAVYKRYSRGYRGDDLVPLAKRKKYHQQHKTKTLTTEIITGGKRYKSALQACTHLGIKYVTFRKRLKRGLSIEQSLGIAPIEDKRFRRGIKRNSKGKKRKKIELNAFGKSYTSYKKLAETFSLPTYVVRERIVKYGYTPEEAVKSDGKAKKVIVEGKEYQSQAQAAEAYGITLPILLGRLNNGLTIEQALGVEIYDTAYTITFEGQKYRNLEHLADTKGISVKALRSRLERGLTLEKAIYAGKRIFNRGRFNRKILERNPELAKSDALLYFVRLRDKERTYYKIGITTKSVEKRLRYKKLQHEETIATINETLLNAHQLEEKILDLIKDKRADITAESLDGYTEVMELTDQEANLIATLLHEYITEKKAADQ